MLLSQFSDPNEAKRSAVSALQLINEMYPICRSITGDGVRRTFDLIEQRIALERSEVPSGTAVFDWIIPPEWNIRDAFVADEQGRRVVDFRASNLHVVGYSTPINQTMSLAELQPHLHSLPDRPDRIPYRTSYYREDWGFCLRHRDREQLGNQSRIERQPLRRSASVGGDGRRARRCGVNDERIRCRERAGGGDDDENRGQADATH